MLVTTRQKTYTHMHRQDIHTNDSNTSYIDKTYTHTMDTHTHTDR